MFGRAGALEERGLDAHALVHGTADLGGRGRGVHRLDDGAADHDDAGAGRDRRGGRLAVDAAGHRHGDRDRLGYGAQRLEGALAAHLLVDGRVDADAVGAELLGAHGARHGVGDLDHVDDELAAVVASPPRRTPWMVLSEAAPSTPTTSAPALAAYSTSVRPASMVFMSATMVCSGNSALGRAPRPVPRP